MAGIKNKLGQTDFKSKVRRFGSGLKDAAKAGEWRELNTQLSRMPEKKDKYYKEVRKMRNREAAKTLGLYGGAAAPLAGIGGYKAYNNHKEEKAAYDYLYNDALEKMAASYMNPNWHREWSRNSLKDPEGYARTAIGGTPLLEAGASERAARRIYNARTKARAARNGRRNHKNLEQDAIKRHTIYAGGETPKQLNRGAHERRVENQLAAYKKLDAAANGAGSGPTINAQGVPERFALKPGSREQRANRWTGKSSSLGSAPAIEVGTNGLPVRVGRRENYKHRPNRTFASGETINMGAGMGPTTATGKRGYGSSSKYYKGNGFNPEFAAADKLNKAVPKSLLRRVAPIAGGAAAAGAIGAGGYYAHKKYKNKKNKENIEKAAYDYLDDATLEKMAGLPSAPVYGSADSIRKAPKSLLRRVALAGGVAAGGAAAAGAAGAGGYYAHKKYKNKKNKEDIEKAAYSMFE